MCRQLKGTYGGTRSKQRPNYLPSAHSPPLGNAAHSQLRHICGGCSRARRQRHSKARLVAFPPFRTFAAETLPYLARLIVILQRLRYLMTNVIRETGQNVYWVSGHTDKCPKRWESYQSRLAMAPGDGRDYNHRKCCPQLAVGGRSRRGGANCADGR